MSRTPDTIDRASELEALERESAIAHQRSVAARTRLSPVGFCHSCEERLESGLFCDADCRDDWQARRDAEARNGRSA